MLSPRFIKWNPNHNRRKELQCMKHRIELRTEPFRVLSGAYRLPFHLLWLSSFFKLFSKLNHIKNSARHILPNKYTKTISVPIPASRLYLHMLPYSVKAHFQCCFNIKLQSLISWCSEQTIRPPSLIKKAQMKYRRAIKVKPHVTIIIGFT